MILSGCWTTSVKPLLSGPPIKRTPAIKQTPGPEIKKKDADNKINNLFC